MGEIILLWNTSWAHAQDISGALLCTQVWTEHQPSEFPSAKLIDQFLQAVIFWCLTHYQVVIWYFQLGATDSRDSQNVEWKQTNICSFSLESVTCHWKTGGSAVIPTELIHWGIPHVHSMWTSVSQIPSPFWLPEWTSCRGEIISIHKEGYR